MVLDEAARGADRRHPARGDDPLAEPRHGRRAGRQPQAGRDPDRRSTILDPVGTAPGLVVPPSDGSGGPTVVVLPGPPRELQPLWGEAIEDRRVRGGGRRRDDVPSRRCCGSSGCRSRRSRRRCARRARSGIDIDRLEITTCLRRGELEIVTRYEPDPAGDLRGVRRASCASATGRCCSPTTARRSTSRWRRCCGRWGGGSRSRSRAPAVCWRGG